MKRKIEVKDIENNVYYKMNPQYFMEILAFACEKRKCHIYMKHYQRHLYDFVMQSTSFLDVQQNIRFGSRLHCIFNNIVEIPICANCGKRQVSMKDVRINEETPRFCSPKCATSDKSVQNKMQETLLNRIGVRHALQNKEICKIATQHKQETNLKKYGVKEAFAAKCVQEKKEKTNINRYGVKCTLQAECVKEKSRQTCLRDYGVEHHMQNKEIYAKSRKTCKDLYGDEYPIRTQPIKDKLNATNRDLYGVDWTFQSDNNKEKAKKRCQEKYGTDYALQADEVKQKAKQTLQDNYGVMHNSQIPSVRSSRSKKYKYNGLQFDSSAELCFYVWLVDHKIDFVYQPQIHFIYEFGGITRHYCPDFQIGDEFYEVKGDHFFKDKDPNKEMICPYDHSQDAQYEAKHQCMIKNNVIIITSSRYQMYYDYVSNMYGKNWWKRFKNSN